MMLGYHEFAEFEDKDVYALSSTTFLRHAQIVQQTCGNDICITFDDGHISQFAIAFPILKELGLPAMFFITTAWVGVLNSVVSWQQLRELCDSGYTVGSHSHTHPMLTACGIAHLRNELSVSRRILEDQLGRDVTSISIPAGRVNDRVLAACVEAGYRRVFTSRVAEYRSASGASPEVVGRFIVTRGIDEEKLASYMRNDPGTLYRLRLVASSKRLVKAVVGDSIYQRAWRRAVRSESHGT